MKRFSVYLKSTTESVASHSYVTAPTAIAAIQAEMLVLKLRFVHHALAYEAGTDGKGESATLIDFVYVPPVGSARKAVR